MKNAFERIHRFLHTPLFGTTPITKETRVDPALFPEDEFPLNCGKCAYSLHGITTDRCPECGTEIDRGRRLVQQYVIESWRAPRNDSRISQFARLIGRATFVLWAIVVAISIAMTLLNRIKPDWLKMTPPMSLATPFWKQVLVSPFGLLMTVILVAYLLAGILTVLHLNFRWKQRDPRRRVLKVIRADYRAGQKRASAIESTSGQSTNTQPTENSR